MRENWGGGTDLLAVVDKTFPGMSSRNLQACELGKWWGGSLFYTGRGPKTINGKAGGRGLT